MKYSIQAIVDEHDNMKAFVNLIKSSGERVIIVFSDENLRDAFEEALSETPLPAGGRLVAMEFEAPSMQAAIETLTETTPAEWIPGATFIPDSDPVCLGLLERLIDDEARD